MARSKESLECRSDSLIPGDQVSIGMQIWGWGSVEGAREGKNHHIAEVIV